MAKKGMDKAVSEKQSKEATMRLSQANFGRIAVPHWAPVVGLD